MARPQKIGLEYFPLNTDIMHNRKMALIEAEFGSKGFAIAIKTLCYIYREKGYYMIYDEETQLLLAKAFGEPGSLVGEVVSRCIKRAIFDESIFNMFQVLTSKTIQENYLSGASRRDKVEIEEEILLVDINDYKNLVSVNINLKNADTWTQSKVKKSKEEKSKEENCASEGKKDPDLVWPFTSETFKSHWQLYKKFRADAHKFKYASVISEQAALKALSEISNSDEATAIKIIDQTFSKNWKGLFPLKNDGQSKDNSTLSLAQRTIKLANQSFAGK
jgi:hypothetical protein